MDPVRTIAVIVAAGKGTRMQAGKKKQYLELDGIPVLVHTLRAFDSHPRTGAMVLVVPGAETGLCRDLTLPHGFNTPLHIIAGGAQRQDSVENGLAFAATLGGDPEEILVMVHDGVRPFVSHRIMDACLERACQVGAAIPAVKVSDTIKQVDSEGMISRTLDRSWLYRAQTPQTLRLDIGLAAFAHARKTGFQGTDEASILEHWGHPVAIVAGSETNIKLTTPQDLVMARFILSGAS